MIDIKFADDWALNRGPLESEETALPLRSVTDGTNQTSQLEGPCLHLLSCGPGLNYQVPHLCFLQFKLELLLSKGRK